MPKFLKILLLATEIRAYLNCPGKATDAPGIPGNGLYD
jgi:hypothetical protein